MIRGYVDNISRNVVAGWAFDESAPDTHLDAEVWLGDQLICSGPANILRSDLLIGKLGKGDHCFRLLLPTLDVDALPRLVVRATRPGGATVELERWRPPWRRPMAPANVALKPLGPASDAASRPVFVLGAARSGTSAVAKAILRSTAYVGADEGHFIEMIGRIDNTVGQFYSEKQVTLGSSQGEFMVDRVSRNFISASVAAMFVSAAQQLFRRGAWLDKTPNSAMISLAPRLAAIWPNARFIFLRRRGLENVASRLRKFPEYRFEAHCQEWSNCMRAWSEARASLQGRALELDQICLARAPEIAASEIGALLGLTPAEVARVQKQLAHARPEKTSADVAATPGVEELHWAAAQRAEFEQYCGEWMDRFGYSRARSYFAREAPANLFFRI